MYISVKLLNSRSRHLYIIIYGIGRPKILDTKIQIIIRYDLTSVIHPNHVGLLRKEQNPKTSHK